MTDSAKGGLSRRTFLAAGAAGATAAGLGLRWAEHWTAELREHDPRMFRLMEEIWGRIR